MITSFKIAAIVFQLNKKGGGLSSVSTAVAIPPAAGGSTAAAAVGLSVGNCVNMPGKNSMTSKAGEAGIALVGVHSEYPNKYTEDVKSSGRKSST